MKSQLLQFSWISLCDRPEGQLVSNFPPVTFNLIFNCQNCGNYWSFKEHALIFLAFRIDFGGCEEKRCSMIYQKTFPFNRAEAWKRV